MLLTENVLRKIIKEEYKKLMNEITGTETSGKGLGGNFNVATLPLSQNPDNVSYYIKDLVKNKNNLEGVFWSMTSYSDAEQPFQDLVTRLENQYPQLAGYVVGKKNMFNDILKQRQSK